jgi:hypothetical protein
MPNRIAPPQADGIGKVRAPCSDTMRDAGWEAVRGGIVVPAFGPVAIGAALSFDEQSKRF